MNTNPISVSIIPYEDAHNEAFKAINYGWLSTYFEVTEYDKPFFEDPKKEILDKNGFIYMASVEDQIVGSVALEKVNDQVYSLAKMGVKPGYQGLKIGKLLLEKAIEKAKQLGIERLILHTHHELIQALNLYTSYGFRFAKVENAVVARATIKMELKLK